MKSMKGGIEDCKM